MCKLKYNIFNKDNLNRIYYNLFYLQKKIYIASKECNNSLVQSLQKLLIHSSNIQNLAINLNNLYYNPLTIYYQKKNYH